MTSCINALNTEESCDITVPVCGIIVTASGIKKIFESGMPSSIFNFFSQKEIEAEKIKTWDLMEGGVITIIGASLFLYGGLQMQNDVSVIDC